jgi:hypothetical protein
VSARRPQTTEPSDRPLSRRRIDDADTTDARNRQAESSRHDALQYADELDALGTMPDAQTVVVNF